MIGALIARDLRRGLTGAAWLPVAFFLLVAALVPFAVGPDARLLARIAEGILWIAALTAALLPIERLVEPDRGDGILDQLALHGLADESVAAAKIAAHWLTFGPLLLFAAIPAAPQDCSGRNAGTWSGRRSRVPTTISLWMPSFRSHERSAYGAVRPGERCKRSG
jgi:ABC-type transport system involved in cytochrome c biogenesis permease component